MKQLEHTVSLKLKCLCEQHCSMIHSTLFKLDSYYIASAKVISSETATHAAKFFVHYCASIVVDVI